MFRLLIFSTLALVLLVGTVQAAEHRIDFDDALSQAQQQGTVVVIDFFTDWCVYCKHFDRDLADAESGVAAALDDVVFTSIDAEKGEGVELAERYGVSSFPTYLVVNHEGELVDRWSGYAGPDHFLGELGPALADPTTAEEKRARYAENPTATDAETLATIAAGERDFTRAIGLYQRAEALDPELDLSEELAYTAYTAWREGEDFTADDFARIVETSLDEDSDAGAWMLGLALVGRVASREERPELRLDFLKRAQARAEAGQDFDEASRTRLEIEMLLHVKNEKEKAAELKKQTLPEGWREDHERLNAFAWWCFENDVNLAEAEELARRGIELAPAGAEKAMILDTAAEICNARGNCRDAITLIERAIAEDPDSETYPKQLERFQKILAESR